MQDLKKHISTEPSLSNIEGNLIPKLRFKGFDNQMQHCIFNDIVVFQSGGTPSKEKSEYWNGSIPWISAASMLGKYYSKSERTITEKGLKNGSRLALKGTLLLLVRGSMLYNKVPIGIAKIDVAFNQDLKALIPNEKSYYEFIYQWFSAKQNFLLQKVTGTGIGAGKLDTDDLKSLRIILPSLPEQQKIAAFLSAIDEKIQQLSRKKKLLEQYKKGVMRQLFSGKLRFKDENGADYVDWEEKKLGDIGETYNGLTGKTKEDFGNGKPYVQYKQIFDDSRIDISRFELVNIGADEKQKKVVFGDVFFTVSSETPNEIGTASVLLDQIDELYLNSFCFGYRANSLELLSPYFSRYLFRCELFRNEIVKLAQGSTRYNMSKVQLMKLKIQLPCLQEQQKIANFLSSIDTKIESTNQQINQMQSFKKGLLQQMFV